MAVSAVLVAAALQVLFAYSTASFLPILFAITLYSGLVLLAAPPFGAPHNRITSDWLRALGRSGYAAAGRAAARRASDHAGV